jgi:SAM-dependent methyltransferase
MKKAFHSAPDRIIFLPKIELDLPAFPDGGRILNLAHGGLDVIGQNAAAPVVAVNISPAELQDVSPDCLRVVMNPCDMKFLDGSFDLAAAFFSMLFIGCDQYAQMFREVHRVLVPGGRFLFWEALIPPRGDSPADIVAVPVEVRTEKGLLSAGYGAAWPEKPFSFELFEDMARDAGLELRNSEESDAMVFFEWIKPPA